jgi:DNA-binding transcriptional MerR regulator/methylmalonyl-CoA mutase cobalamin-binding subunit
MDSKSNELYSIRQVIELTGVSEFTLRGWETRYVAFSPVRSETGRRLYSRDDLIKIRLLFRLLNQGQRIGAIAHLGLKQLELLAEKGESLARDSESDLKGKALARVSEVMALAGRFGWDEIQKTLAKTQSALGHRKFVFEFLLGLIGEMNRQSDQGRFSVAQEHIMTAFLKENLYGVIAAAGKKANQAYRFVLATPEGDFHEMGVLIAAAILSLEGIKYVNLGPHVPKADLCEVSLRCQATHILISSTISGGIGPDRDFLKYVNFLDRQLDPGVIFLLGGRNAANEKFVLKRQFHILDSFSDFEVVVSQLKKR